MSMELGNCDNCTKEDMVGFVLEVGIWICLECYATIEEEKLVIGDVK